MYAIRSYYERLLGVDRLQGEALGATRREEKAGIGEGHARGQRRRLHHSRLGLGQTGPVQAGETLAEADLVLAPGFELPVQDQPAVFSGQEAEGRLGRHRDQLARAGRPHGRGKTQDQGKGVLAARRGP